MTDILKIVRVFLASPGDLDEERKLAKTTVDELNKTWCGYLGYYVELMGWEDTVAAFGRAQEIINQDVIRCDLFIGMLWRRWGTPPAKDGRYTSGFEEEFAISLDRRSRSGRPEISVFFKEVPADQLRDPGVDLQKVLAFRKKLADDNTVLYQQFVDAGDLARKIERSVSQFVQRLHQEEQSKIQEETQSLPTNEQRQNDPAESSTRQKTNPLSAEGESFLRDLVDRASGDLETHPISALDVARLRLLGSQLGQSGNDERALGVHDANLLFFSRSHLNLGNAEIVGLMSAGCEHYSSENVPFWHWFRKWKGFDGHRLSLLSLGGSDSKRIGALQALTLVEEPLCTDEVLQRDFYLKNWLSAETPAIRLAALQYLADCGEESDIEAVREELARAHYQTSKAAMNAIICISSRIHHGMAIKALYELQPPTVNAQLLNRIFSDETTINTETLLEGLDHKASSVRLKCLTILESRNGLTPEIAERLLNDEDADVRLRALQSLERNRGAFSTEEAKKILVRPRPNLGFASLFGGPDTEEDRTRFDRYRTQMLRALSNDELKRAIKSSSIDQQARFILMERNFPEFGDEIRLIVRDQGSADFKRTIETLKATLRNSASTIETLRSIEEGIRKSRTRQALDVLCRKGGAADLALVRSAIRSGFTALSEEDLGYLARYGDHSDAQLIIDAVKQRESANIAFASAADDGIISAAARALYSLGRGKLEETLRKPMPTALLAQLVLVVPDPALGKISDAAAFHILNVPSDADRRTVVLKLVRSNSDERLLHLLDRYIASDRQRYYNVIHWFDFAVSAPRAQVRQAVDKLLSPA